MRVLIAMFVLCIATAASVKINVTGELTNLGFFTPTNVSNSTDIDPNSPELVNWRYRDVVLASSGSMRMFDTEPFPGDPEIAFANCTGILTFMCFSGTVFGQTLNGFSFDFISFIDNISSADFNVSGFNYVDDSFSSWSNEQGAFFYELGINATYKFNSFSVAQVPLPASSLLFLAGLGLLAGQRRFKPS